MRDFAAAEGLGLGKVAQPLRVALSGRTVSLGVFDMMEILGRDESLARLDDCAKTVPSRSEGVRPLAAHDRRCRVMRPPARGNRTGEDA